MDNEQFLKQVVLDRSAEVPHAQNYIPLDKSYGWTINFDPEVYLSGFGLMENELYILMEIVYEDGAHFYTRVFKQSNIYWDRMVNAVKNHYDIVGIDLCDYGNPIY